MTHGGGCIVPKMERRERGGTSEQRRGVLTISHGLVFSFAAGGSHWPIAIRCPSLPFPLVKVHEATVLVRRFRFSMVTGCLDQNIEDPYGNTLHLHKVTFMLMAECFHRMRR